MSVTTLIVGFGPTNRNSDHPRELRVLGELVVGGSGVYLFHNLEEGGGPVRLRPQPDVPEAQVLMCGFLLADPSVPASPEAEALASRLRAGKTDIALTVDDAKVLSDAVAHIAVTAVVTGVVAPAAIGPADFADTGWTVLAPDQGERTASADHGSLKSDTGSAQDEYDLIPEMTGSMARRDPAAAQRMFTMLLSEWVGRDGYALEYGMYNTAASIEVLGVDGRRLIVAPLHRWVDGEAVDLEWEWAMSDAKGVLLPHPEEPDEDLAEIWGSATMQPDLAGGIEFYRSALDEARRVAGFVPVDWRATREPVQHWEDDPAMAGEE